MTTKTVTLKITKRLSKLYQKSLLSIAHPLVAFITVHYYIRRSIFDFLAFFNLRRYPYRIIFLTGMAKGGSSWMKNLLAQIPFYCTRKSSMPFEVAYRQDICDQAFSHTPKYSYTLFKTHLNPKQENLNVIFRNGVEKVLIMYRDLRDVTISRYHHEIVDPKPKKAFDYIDYIALGKKAAMDHCIEFVGTFWVDWINGWMDIAKKEPTKFKLIRFEDLKENPENVFKEVLSFYNISLSNKKIERIIKKSKGQGNFNDNIRDGKILPFALSSTFRSGEIGQWKKEFTDNQIAKCKQYMGDALIRMGYEKDLNW